MKSKRDLFLVFTILAFLVTAPVVTLYTAGYRYHFKKQRFERVGFFETSSLPSGASVILDGTQVGKTPYVDMGILPGRYSLRLEQPGFRPFVTEFDVRSGLSTLLLDTVLWRDTEPTLKATTPASAVMDPQGLHVAWTEALPDGTAAMVSLVNGEKKRLGCVLRASTNSQVTWNPSGQAALFTVTTASGVDGCVVGLNGNTYLLRDMLNGAVGRAMSMTWAPFDDAHLLVRGAQADTVLAFERKENRVVFPQSVPFTIRGSRLFGVQATTSGAELFAQSLTSLSLHIDDEPVALPSGDYAFMPSPAKYIVVRESRFGRIDIFRASNLERLSTVIAERLVFAADGDRFLAVNGYELSLYDLDEETSRLVTRYSQPITDAIWHPLEQHALVVVDGRVIALPFERSAEEAVTLATFEHATGLRTDSRGSVLTLLGTRDGQTGAWTIALQ